MRRFYFTVAAVVAIIVGGLAAIIFTIESEKCLNRYPTVYRVRWNPFVGCELNLTHGHWLPADSVRVFR